MQYKGKIQLVILAKHPERLFHTSSCTKHQQARKNDYQLFKILFIEITRCCQENSSSKSFRTLAPNENLTNTTLTHNVRRGRTLDVYVLSLTVSSLN